MSINRRKFLEISSITAVGATFATTSGAAAALINAVDAPGISHLRNNFVNPPLSVRSSCYWWWFNGLVNEEGITRDLEEFKAKGMGEVLLVNSAGGLGGVPYPQGAKFMSDEWKVYYRHAMKEAKRLGIAVGINLSSGWCMGGPWIKPENSGRWYLQSELELTGPQQFNGKLPLPGSRVGYDNVFNPPGFKDYIDLPLEKLDYRDTAITAIKISSENHRISGSRAAVLPAKTNHKDASNFALATDIMGPTRVEWQGEPHDAPIALADVIDLTNQVDKDGNLKWDVPAGKWKIIRTGHRMTGSKLMIAQPEADGLSVDWFDQKGVEIQFEVLGRMLIDEAAKVGAKPAYFCDDSFEDGFPNWTEKMLKQFEKYRGYDASPYLPVLSGYIISSAEVSDRFLTDYRKTLADCMADEHYKRFAELCHKEGMLVQNEAAGPSRSGTVCIDGLKNLGRSDNPMGEFWLGLTHEDETTLTPDKSYGVSRLDKGQNKVTKMVASAAHIYGKQLVSAEAFTTMRHWVDYPGSLKQSLDRAFCEGVNRIAIHTSTSSRPQDGKPGYEYGAGTHFNPNVTWWEKSGAFFDYVARSQYLLRSGKFVADVLFYNGDSAPNLVEQKHLDPRLGMGYDYDVCNEEVLLTRLSVKNKQLVLPDGMTYKLLVLPACNRMPLAVLKKIGELVKAGATVIGQRPTSDSGLKNYPKCDEDIKTLGAKIWGNADGQAVKMNSYGAGRVFVGTSIRDILLSDNVLPDFEFTGGKEDLVDYIHRTTADAEIYFLANRHRTPVTTTTCTFRCNRVPEIWDGVTAKVTKNVGYELKGGRVHVPLQFDAFQSYFIVFPKVNPAATSNSAKNFHERKQLMELKGPWAVAFDINWGGPKEATFAELQDWSTHADDRIKFYSGKAVYDKTFSFNAKITKPVYLNLGVVKNIAEVMLNGKSLGVIWTAPWQVDITSVLKQGTNELKIEVINQWPNRLIGDAALPKEKRLTNTNIQFKATDKLLSSGLLGPVTINT